MVKAVPCLSPAGWRKGGAIPVAIVIREIGEEVTGKCASIGAENVCLLSDIIFDKKGVFRGNRKETVAADNPPEELMTATW